MPLVHQTGLPLVALLVFLTELGIPSGIPNEVFLLVAGATVVHSLLGLAGAVGLVALADLFGTTGLFLLSHTGGGRLATRLGRGRDGERILLRWRGRVGRSARRDVAMVVGGRLLPLARMPFTLAMGLLGLRPQYFLFGAIPGALVWAGWPLTVGYILRDQVHEVIKPVERVSRAGGFLLPLAVALLLLALLGRWTWGRLHHPATVSPAPAHHAAPGADER